MKQQHADYQVVPYPKYRRWMVAAFRSTHHKPMMHGLLEVDVSRARAHLRDHQAPSRCFPCPLMELHDEPHTLKEVYQ
jgi:hypothetical protein